MIGAAVLTVLALLGCIFAPQPRASSRCAIFVTGVGHRGLAAGPAGLRHRGGARTGCGPRRCRRSAGCSGSGCSSARSSAARSCTATGLWGAYAVHIVAAAGRRRQSCCSSRTCRSQHDAAPAGRSSRGHRSDRCCASSGRCSPRSASACWWSAPIRAARQVVLPLWGQHLGLSPAAISVIFGISGAIDMLLFYPAGKVMDRFGRAWVADPVDDRPRHLAAAGAVHRRPRAGAAAGRPADGRRQRHELRPGDDARRRPRPAGPAAGVPRASGGCSPTPGNGVGPFVIAGITAVASLGVGIVAMGVVGLLGAGWLGFWIPRRPPPPAAGCSSAVGAASSADADA